MDEKKFFLWALAMMLMAVPVMAANTAITFPTTSSTVSGTVDTNMTAGTNISRMETWVSCTGNANTTLSLIQNLSVNINGTTPDGGTWNGSWVTSTVEDGSSCTLSAYENGTAASASVIVVVNNTVPTAPTSMTPSDDSDNTSSNDLTFTVSVNSAKTTGCTLYFEGGAVPSSGDSFTMTHSGSTCTADVSDLADSAGYKWFVEATDGLDTVNSVYQSFSIDIDDGNFVRRQAAAVVASEAESPLGFTQEGNGKAVLIVIIALVGVAIISGKKKGGGLF